MISKESVAEVIRIDVVGTLKRKSLKKETLGENRKLKSGKSKRKVKRCESAAPMKMKDRRRNENLRKNEHDTDHFKMYQEIITFFLIFGKLFGARLSYDWKPERYVTFWCSLILLTVTTCFCIPYTQYMHLMNGNHMKFIEVFAVYGITSSCVLKTIQYLRYRNEILALHYFVRKLCERNVIGRRADIIKKHLRQTFRFLKLFPLLTALCIALFVACPIKSYIVDKELMSPLPIEIIFVDQSTTSGFLIANSAMSMMGILAYLLSVYYGLQFIFCILTFSLQVDLIEEDFKDLNEMWLISPLTVRYKQAFLTNICMKCQDMKNYITAVKRIFENKIFLYFCFNYVSQIICLFEIATIDWKPGYSIAVGLSLEMMFYCFMGTQISINNERLCAIINKSDWYLYDLQSQKTILLLLHSSQNARDIRIGPLGPLSVSSGIEIFKSIYSYYAILTEIL